ncbi:MAG: hypothetical protein V4726_04630 [Verrucomicrobiota bacterium]
MIRLKDKIILTFSLIGLFGAGIGCGLLWGDRGWQVSQKPPDTPITAAVSPAEWWNLALDHLGGDLHLTAGQRQKVQPLLEHSSQRMFLNRDRALFQMHLELLSFHDELIRRPGLLDPAQQSRLAAARGRLRQRIGERFPQFVADTPIPAATALVSP